MGEQHYCVAAREGIVMTGDTLITLMACTDTHGKLATTLMRMLPGHTVSQAQEPS